MPRENSDPEAGPMMPEKLKTSLQPPPHEGASRVGNALVAEISDCSSSFSVSISEERRDYDYVTSTSVMKIQEGGTSVNNLHGVHERMDNHAEGITEIADHNKHMSDLAYEEPANSIASRIFAAHKRARWADDLRVADSERRISSPLSIFGTMLATFRTMRGESIQGLAEVSGVDPDELMEIELGFTDLERLKDILPGLTAGLGLPGNSLSHLLVATILDL